MALTSPMQPWYIKKFVGMNSRIEDNEMSVEHSVLTQNARFEGEPGAVDKRYPISYYNSTKMNDPDDEYVHSSYRWNNGENSILMAASKDKMYIGSDSDGVMHQIKSGLTEGKYFNFVVYKSQCIFGNGYDNTLVTDGSTDYVCWELGACKAKLASGGSNLDSAATYSYKLTFDDGALVTGAVSNTVTTSSGYRKVTLSFIPQAPSGYLNIKLYRTEGGGSTYKLLDTYVAADAEWTNAGTTDPTTYTDDIVDASLTDVYPAVTDAPFKGNLLQIHRERLFISGNPNEQNKIVYSEPYLPHYIQHVVNSRFMEISKDDGDVIQGIPISLGVMLCVKRNSFRKVHITTPTSGASPDSWYADDPIQYVGTPSERTILQTPYGIFFLNRDGWYLWDGSKAQPVMDEFDPEDILESDFSNCVAHFFNTKDGLILMSYTDSTTASPSKNRQMVYNWKRQAMSVDTLYIGSYASYAADSSELFYGDSRTGHMYYGINSEKFAVYNKKSEIEALDVTYTETSVGGEEDSPTLRASRTYTIDEGVGNPLTDTINGTAGTIDLSGTSGTMEFPAIQLDVGEFGRFYWNELKYHPDDVISVYMRSGADKAACEAASWGTEMTDPNGSDITAAANPWIQWKFVWALNSTLGSAEVIKSSGFLFKFSYKLSIGSFAEANVEFVHRVGWRNFEAPDVDKIFKTIATNHSGVGTYEVRWETENSSGAFIVDATANPVKWKSFFPSSAMGTKLDITIYKNDLSDMRIKEIKGYYTPEPLIA